MNTKTILFDFGIPVLTVVGAAVVTYLLTGGEEEYPLEQQLSDYKDDNKQQIVIDDALDTLQLQSNDFNQCVLDLKVQLSSMEHSHTDNFNEVNQKLDIIMKELNYLKTNAQFNTHKATDVKNATQSYASPSTSFAAVRSQNEWIRLLHQSVAHFALGVNLSAAYLESGSEESLRRTCDLIDLEINKIDTSSSSSTNDTVIQTPLSALSDGCDILLMYANNLIRSSSVPRYRKLSASNGAYKNTLSKLAGYRNVLRMMGFVQKESGAVYEWQWTPERIKLQQLQLQQKSHESVAEAVPSSEEDVSTLLQLMASLLQTLKTDRVSLLRQVRGILGAPIVESVPVESQATSALPAISDAKLPVADGSGDSALENNPQSATVDAPVLASFDEIFNQVKSSRAVHGKTLEKVTNSEQ